jgi:LPS-assembly lipoprotein
MSHQAQRRHLLRLASAGAVGAGLNGCGFKLRGSMTYAFTQLALLPSPGGPLVLALRRALTTSVAVLAADQPLAQAQVVLRVLQEQRERVVVASNASGQVRELELRLRVKFRLSTPQEQEIIPDTEILQTRSISYNETAALAKDAEEAFLYRDMQDDIVQQITRRLAAVKQLPSPLQPA